jgi:pimeloyl-ACP methyl ester carboxylesterase
MPMIEPVEPRGSPAQTFVLVHGACHGGWCWARVAERLRDAGHRVLTPTLTGHGDRVHLLSPDVGLATYIEDIVATLEMEEVAEAILVGHSFAGGPITGAADRVPERIAHLVYLDAFLPRNGESVFSFLAPELVAARRKLAGETSGGLTYPAGSPGSFAVTAPEDVAWLERRLRPEPLRGYEDALSLTHPFGNGRRTTYIACVMPPYPAMAAMHARARSETSWRYLELATGHDAMVLAPAALSDMLLRLAA